MCISVNRDEVITIKLIVGTEFLLALYLLNIQMPDIKISLVKIPNYLRD